MVFEKYRAMSLDRSRPAAQPEWYAANDLLNPTAIQLFEQEYIAFYRNYHSDAAVRENPTPLVRENIEYALKMVGSEVTLRQWNRALGMNVKLPNDFEVGSCSTLVGTTVKNRRLGGHPGAL